MTFNIECPSCMTKVNSNIGNETKSENFSIGHNQI